ncbi:MAG TPA: DivIVA domain-containing protein [Jatrophihabitantaceae bacterium]|jgi:DivIVA domain-containing protein
MSDDNTPAFRTTMRGYEPEAVDKYIAQLAGAVSTARREAADLARRVEDLAKRQQHAAPPSGAPTFADLGERISQMLTLAEEEAASIRESAVSETERKVAELEASNSKARSDADRYASETRSSADREAARIVEDARRGADQLVDEAEREATARRREAEALYEDQRAKAAKAASDFEQTLAERRANAERDFQEQTRRSEQELAAAQEQVTGSRAEADRIMADANRKSARLTAESEAKAEQIVADAVARADRIRAESEREVAAATQRRDSINAQLTNVRQMLATLSGTSAAAIGADFDDHDEPANAEH